MIFIIEYTSYVEHYVVLSILYACTESLRYRREKYINKKRKLMYKRIYI